MRLSGLSFKARAARTDRRAAEELAEGFPALLARASQLASSLSLGVHGSRRAGTGEEFWQYRPAATGDLLHQIDWRKSARTDEHYLRQREWQTSQSVTFWIDLSQSMLFRSRNIPDRKADRARLLGLALAILLIRAGERIGLLQDPEPARTGEAQLVRFSGMMLQNVKDDYGIPAGKGTSRWKLCRRLISDFLGGLDRLKMAFDKIAAQRVAGYLVHILDPAEADFPFDGQRIFKSMNGGIKFETQRAAALRKEYKGRLETLRSALGEMAQMRGWRYLAHITSESPLPALLWLYVSLEDRN